MKMSYTLKVHRLFKPLADDWINLFLFTILLILLAGIPFVLRFSPFIDEYGKHACIWDYNETSDNYYNQRLILIFWGLLLTVVATLITIRSFKKKAFLSASQLRSITLLLLIFHIGWKDYPFWINGLHNAAFPIANGHYDPKALLTGPLFLGPVWHLGVLMGYLLTVLSPLFLLFLMLKKGIAYRKLTAISFILFLNASLFFLTPGYLQWLLD